MRALLLSCLLVRFLHVEAQQVDWLTSWPMNYTMNPGMPDQTLASAPGRLISMRTEGVTMIFGQEAYGTVALQALDPATGNVLLSCYLGDSVAVEAAAVSGNIGYFCGRFTSDALQ